MSKFKQRKGTRRQPPAVRPPVSGVRVAPIGAAVKDAEAGSEAPTKRVPGEMDFSYLSGELRRIVVIGAGMLGLLVVLSIVLR